MLRDFCACAEWMRRVLKGLIEAVRQFAMVRSVVVRTVCGGRKGLCLFCLFGL